MKYQNLTFDSVIIPCGSMIEVNIEDDEESFEYYMRRGDKLYFRGILGKMVIETKDSFKERYGAKVKIEW